jgi:hypothetical protein
MQAAHQLLRQQDAMLGEVFLRHALCHMHGLPKPAIPLL